MSKIAIRVSAETHAMLKDYAEQIGVELVEATERVLTTGFGRLAALRKYADARKPAAPKTSKKAKTKKVTKKVTKKAKTKKAIREEATKKATKKATKATKKATKKPSKVDLETPIETPVETPVETPPDTTEFPEFLTPEERDG